MAAWIQDPGGVKDFATHYESFATLLWILHTLTKKMLIRENVNGSLEEDILKLVEDNKRINRLMATKMRIM